MEVRRLAVTITLESPLVVSERRPAAQPEGLDYLPGARLRGALVEALRDPAAGEPLSASALHALLDGPEAPRFLDAWPSGAIEPLPATAASCADAPGFATTRAGHGVFDTLIDRACWEILSPAGLLYQPRCPHPDCDALAVPFTGSYGTRAVGGRLVYARGEAPRRRLAGAGVDAYRATVDPEAVYTLPVLSEAAPDPFEPAGPLRPTVLRAEIVVFRAEHEALLQAALPRVRSVGGGRSRGLGIVRVEVGPAAAGEPLAARLERFRLAFGRRRAQYAKLAPQSAAALEGGYFSLDLRADTLLRPDGWTPQLMLDADRLRALLDVDDPSLTLVRAYTAPAWRGGWHSGWALPRPPELAVRRGSCFLFRTADPARWEAPLARLEARGLGERTTEGFGDVRVCDPFHLILREQAV
ncbi:MAG TPA: CRISPR-associated RAMP protein Csx10 [Chloroflexota bacterium]|nr:CRISPR-associated RAMP protein Csx10 [Chloroflexota bacterium]